MVLVGQEVHMAEGLTNILVTLRFKPQPGDGVMWWW